MDALELRVPPPVWALAIAALMYGISLLDAGWSFAGSNQSAGFGIGVIGLAIIAFGIIDVRSVGSTVDPHDPKKTTALVQTGVYRFSRNPMYLGMAVMLVGWGMGLADSIAAIIGVGLFVVIITRLQIQPEERILEKRFGKSYRAYQARVRRWL